MLVGFGVKFAQFHLCVGISQFWPVIICILTPHLTGMACTECVECKRAPDQVPLPSPACVYLPATTKVRVTLQQASPISSEVTLTLCTPVCATGEMKGKIGKLILRLSLDKSLTFLFKLLPLSRHGIGSGDRASRVQAVRSMSTSTTLPSGYSQVSGELR